MTPLADPLPPDSDGQGVFEYSLEDLEMVGVNLPQEQRWLFEQCVGGGLQHAMTVMPIIDPGDRYHLTTPAIAWDEETKSEVHILYPVVVELDWSEMLVDDVYERSLAHENAWSRFPSLPGRQHGLGYYECDLGDYEAFRIWNLWPIDASDVPHIEEALMEWACDQDTVYGMLDLWRAVQCGDYEICDFASSMGLGDEQNHEHKASPHGGYYDECITGMEAFNSFEDELYVEPVDGAGYYLRNMPGPELPPYLRPAWESLLISSQTNSFRAVDAFPPWDREDLIKSERWYSSWLWLS